MLREFLSVKELLGYIDSQIAQYRKILGDLIRVVEDLRARSERQKRVVEVFGKLAPRNRALDAEDLRSIDIRGVKVLIDPSPAQELSSLEGLLEEMNAKIARLADIRKDMEALASIDPSGRVIVFFKDDVPETIILKT